MFSEGGILGSFSPSYKYVAASHIFFYYYCSSCPASALKINYLLDYVLGSWSLKTRFNDSMVGGGLKTGPLRTHVCVGLGFCPKEMDGGLCSFSDSGSLRCTSVITSLNV